MSPALRKTSSDHDDRPLMKAVAVEPGKRFSAALREVPAPSIDSVSEGRGVLVRTLQVGVDGTDREIIEGQYGAAPEGEDHLIIGHESLGAVEEVGPNVAELAPGDVVVATVRRPGDSIYDRIGMPDMTTDSTYRERGISLLHGFLCEFFVEDAQHLVKVPNSCREVGVLVEPASIIAKGVSQAFEIQRRLKVWKPRRAAVAGAGTIGLLAALLLRLRGLDVTVFGLEPPPYLNSDLIEELGASYVSVRQTSILEAGRLFGAFDLIFEATGNSAVVFEAAQTLTKNGVLILSSVTPGEGKLEIPADRINLDFVLGNRLMFGTVNANRLHFEDAVGGMALAQSEYPDWLSKLLTHRVRGLDNYRDLIRLLFEERDAIKVLLEI